tara:strand:+ start:10472 stop:10858 length:387 start_codon:yes stop_codon:yes gene_type:complete
MSSLNLVRTIVQVIRERFVNSSNEEKDEMIDVLKKLVFFTEKTESEIDANMSISLEENLLNQGYSMEEIHLNDCDMDDMDENEKGSWWQCLTDEQKIIILDTDMEDYWNYSYYCKEYTNDQIINWLLN